MMKSNKRIHAPWLAAGVGALALYGAYSAVMCIKNGVCKGMGKVASAMKKDRQSTPCCYTEGEEQDEL